MQLHKTHSDVGKALTQALIEADSSLHRHKTRTTLSGTTALMGVVSGATLTVAHVGDSRAVLATRAAPGAAPTARQLTVDHTPRVPEEHERVTRAGAVILTVDQLEGIKDKSLQCWGPEFDGDGDPPRVWAPNADWPGTAFTRSLGDRGESVCGGGRTWRRGGGGMNIEGIRTGEDIRGVTSLRPGEAET